MAYYTNLPGYSRQSGINLLEMLIVLSITGILASIALPDLGKMLSRYEGEKIMNSLARAIAFARAQAVEQGAMITFCRSSDGLKCKGSWHEGAIIFTDYNADRIINYNDQILLHTPAVKTQGTLKFRAFQNKQYLQLTPLGFTNYQNGNFTWCPEDKDPRQARQLIISYTGRTRLAVDSNNDGIRENASGKNISC